MSVLETEYHYLLICPKYYYLRTHGLPYINLQNSNRLNQIVLYKTYWNLYSLPIKPEVEYLTPN